MKIKTNLKKYAHIFIAISIIIQPIMDIASFWLIRLDYPTTVIKFIRLFIFLSTVCYGYLVSTKKNIYYLSFAIVISLYVAHFLACNEFGINNMIGDFSNYMKIIVMPLSTISLISFMKCNDKTLNYLKNSLGIVFIIMVSVQILSTLTKTDPHTYEDGTGIIGWFFVPNSQSANLTTLAPFFILMLLSNKKIKTSIFIILTLLTCLSMYLLSTRLAYFGIITNMMGIGISLIILKKKKKEALIFISLAIIFLTLIFISPMFKHQKNYNNAQNYKQNLIDSFLANNEEILNLLNSKINNNKSNETISKDEEKKLIKGLTPIYETYVGDFVKIFGAADTIKMYNYSTNAKTFSAIRPKKLKFAKLLMNKSPNSTRWFGIELSRFTVNTLIYDVENDLHGIYYLLGGVGFTLCISFLGYFIYLIIYALTTNAKKYFTLDAIICGIAFINNLAHIYNTSGVLRSPNASIYLSTVLGLIYYLVKIKKYDKGEEK